MFRVNMVFFLFYFFSFFFFFAINKKILHRYLNTSSSFSQIRTFVRLKKDTIEYMNRQEQSREDQDRLCRYIEPDLHYLNAIRAHYMHKRLFLY